MKSLAAREAKSTKWCYNDKEKNKAKFLLLLSTLYEGVRVSKDEGKKPHAIVYYDHTKGGVDVIDLVSNMLSTRWPYFVLDTLQFLMSAMDRT